jgi:hypothetical protein
VSGASSPRRGDVFVLPEDDYKFGIGPVIARVTAVHSREEFDAETWWHVSAAVANGTPDRHGGWQTRDLYIREATFPRTRRVPRV